MCLALQTVPSPEARRQLWHTLKIAASVVVVISGKLSVPGLPTKCSCPLELGRVWAWAAACLVSPAPKAAPDHSAHKCCQAQVGGKVPQEGDAEHWWVGCWRVFPAPWHSAWCLGCRCLLSVPLPPRCQAQVDAGRSWHPATAGPGQAPVPGRAQVQADWHQGQHQHPE